MAAGFEIRTDCQLTMLVRKSDAPLAQLNLKIAQSGDAFSLLGANRSVLTSLVVTLVAPVVLYPRFGVNRSRQRNRGWAVALILKPVPQRVGATGRLIA